MEAFEEAIAASKEQSLIFKGKRTKRQRPQSPIPFSISPPIVSSLAPNMEEESTDLDHPKDNSLDNNVENRKKYGVITSSSSSASWSSNNNPTYKTEQDEEDQEIANCLILLSQGNSLPHNEQQLKTPCHETNNNGYRFSSRRFLETSSSNGGGGGKAGYYVYQCKTCDRTFPSFQALGGHRASHKKPKATSFYSNLDLKKNIYENNNVSLTTTTICNNKNNNNRSLVFYGKSSNNKVHECGICGAEFTSGQALGGHMRRHRGAVVVTAAATPPTVVTVATARANTELSLSSMSFDQISDGQDHLLMPTMKKAKNMNVSLDLDLNLPAPEDENRVNGFNFALKQKHEQEQQHETTKQREEPKSLVLSSPPTLVDCYY